MSTRDSVLICLLVLLISITVAPNVQAQTTTYITNLQYPKQVVLQNGVAQATVTFTVVFSGLPSDYHLLFGILYVGTMNFVKGSATSTPDSCAPMRPGSPYVAFCIVTTMPSSGAESASFTLSFNSTQQYNLWAGTAVTDQSNNLIRSTITKQDFTISVTAQTVPTSPQTTTGPQTTNPQLSTSTIQLTTAAASTSTTAASTAMIILGLSIIALPFIGIIGLIVFVIRRRKGERTGGTAAEGLASRPSPAPVPTVEGTKFCMACGVRIPAAAGFCASCGGKQD